MKKERWREIDRLLDMALDVEPDERSSLLDRLCHDDGLRKDVEALLAAHDRADDFLSVPALDVAAQTVAASERSLVGQRLGPYELVDRLGRGGMADVYRARDTRLGRNVAIKVMPPAVSGDPERLARFELEARIAGSLNHPNVLTIHDVGTHDGSPYIVAELLEGETLRATVGRGPVPVAEAVGYATQVARGLAAAHARGVIHRDVKPENLFVTVGATVKILDFGIAKLMRPEALTISSNAAGDVARTPFGVILGTVAYMSPEQIRGDHLDHRSDLFSLGAVMSEMLTGSITFRRNTAAASIAAILEEEPRTPEPSLNIPDSIVRAVRWCLEKDVERRCPSAEDLIDALAGA